MRCTYFICFVVIIELSINFNVLNAQEFIGMRTDNYAGSNGMLLNPASPIAGKLAWDLNIVGAGLYEDNNYISIPTPFLKYISTADSIIDIDYFNPKKIYGHGNILLQLPSGFVKVGDFAGGIFFSARSAGYFLADKHPPTTTGLKDIPLYTPTDMPGFNAGILIWAEAGLNGEVSLEQNSVFALHMGANLKYLTGFEALGFENNSLFNFTKDTVNFAISSFNTDFNYTKNLGSNSLYDKSNYSINGGGMGIDFGMVYELHRKSKFNFSKNLNYSWKFGASLLDFGYIKFDKNSGNYHLEEDESFLVQNIVLDSIDDIDEFNRTGSRLLYDLSSASQNADYFTMMLPAALVLTVDKNFNNAFYVNALIVRRIPRFGTNLIARANTFALTPRYEKKEIGFMLPLSLYEDKEFRFGAAARLWFLTIGSDNLLTFMNQKDYSSINMYMSVKINPYWLIAENKKKILECLKNITDK